jgi:dipeptide/tripeptide permease
LAFILLFAAILKAPSDKIPEIINTLVAQPLVWWFMGWITAGILLIAAVVVFSMMRRIYLNEIDRLKQERDELQEKLTQQTLQHSRFKGGKI